MQRKIAPPSRNKANINSTGTKNEKWLKAHYRKTTYLTTKLLRWKRCQQTTTVNIRTVGYHTEVIYLDWAVTAPSFLKAGQEASTWHANPSSPHPYGRLALADLDSARARIAKTLHAAPDEIVFTSGATESNNLVLQSILTLLHPERRTPRRDTLVISAVEHDSVDGMATLLSRIG